MGGDEVLGDEVGVFFTVASGVGECLFCQGQHFGWERERERVRRGEGWVGGGVGSVERVGGGSVGGDVRFSAFAPNSRNVSFD